MDKKKIKIQLNTFVNVKKFSSSVEKFTADIDIKKGRYIIDAKSIMGLFSLDLSKPVEVEIHSDDEKMINEFRQTMKKFEVE